MTETPVAKSRSDSGVRSITRAVDLLSFFDAHHPRRDLRELVELTGLPKTTTVRLLSTLETAGLIAVTSEATYAVGAGFLRWVRLAETMWEVSAQTRSAMRTLVDRCGETVNIYIRQDVSRVSIAQEEGTATVRSVVEVGVPLPLTAGATAKILLSAAPDRAVDDVIAYDGDVDRETLLRELASVRETGYAVSHGDRELGASAVAAPIRNADGTVIAALSASGPTSRFTADRVSDYVLAVTATADEIGRAGLGAVEAFL